MALELVLHAVLICSVVLPAGTTRRVERLVVSVLQEHWSECVAGHRDTNEVLALLQPAASVLPELLSLAKEAEKVANEREISSCLETLSSKAASLLRKAPVMMQVQEVLDFSEAWKSGKSTLAKHATEDLQSSLHDLIDPLYEWLGYILGQGLETLEVDGKHILLFLRELEEVTHTRKSAVAVESDTHGP